MGSILDSEFARPTPTWEKDCEAPGCAGFVQRFRGEGDVTCSEGDHSYNAGGQRLRDNWRNNPAWLDDDMDDMEGYERECLSIEGGY